jgi:hypothetical protein
MHRCYPGPAQCKLVRAEFKTVEATGKSTCGDPKRINKLQGIRSRVRDEVKECFSILSPGVYSASNTNEYQKQKNNVSGE